MKTIIGIVILLLVVSYTTLEARAKKYRSYLNYEYLQKKFGRGNGVNIAVVDTNRDPTDKFHALRVLSAIEKVAPDATIILYDYLDTQLRFQQIEVLQGLLNLIKQGRRIDIINLSWVSQNTNQEFHDVLQELHDRGVKIVCSSGNNGVDGREFYPAKYSSEGIVFSIGSYHNRRTKELEIWTSRPYNTLAPSCVRIDSKSNFACGTSISAGFASGLLAVLKDFDLVKNYLEGLPVEPVE